MTKEPSKEYEQYVERLGSALSAMSLELKFTSENYEIADAVWREELGDERIRGFTQAAYERSELQVRQLLELMRMELDKACNGLKPIAWEKYRKWNWYINGELELPGVRKLGVGMQFGYGLSARRLIAYCWPEAGEKEYSGKLAALHAVFRNGLTKTKLSSEDESLSWWFDDGDCLVWYDQELSTNTPLIGEAKLFRDAAERMIRSVKGQ